VGPIRQRSGGQPTRVTGMRAVRRLLRFFHVVAPVPRLMLATFAAVTIAAAVLTLVQPAKAADAVAPLLLLQLFAASSGFSLPARRGHYDLILTAGESRVRIAAAHWMMSIAPGIASWLLLGAVEIARVGPGRASTITSGSCAAFILMSTIPWATSASLPRFAAAIGWQLLLSLLIVSLSADTALRLFGSMEGGRAWIEAMVAVLVYPPVLVGESIASARGLIVIPSLLVSAAAMACALMTIDRQDIPLEGAQ
jgi:hypothetical protein